MPSPFGVSKSDLLRSKTVTPGWYPARIKAVNQKAAKTDGSTNTIISFIITKVPFEGVPVDGLFSEKAPGFAAPLMAALLGRPVNPEGEDVDFEMGIGKEVLIYVINDKYMGRMTNKIEDYKAMGK
jgi:hypothetical protein